MKFRHTIPILYSSNVVKSLDYYTEILGFEDRWDWGHPPTFGGVSKGGVQIFFCEKGQGHPGTWLAIMISNVDEYYETITAKGARVSGPPKNMEWGLREMLVQDPDDHVIRFGQNISLRESGEGMLPQTIRILQRIPTASEYRRLVNAVHWSVSADNSVVEKALAAPLFAVVAEDTDKNEVVGCALLLGDHATFYYVKDVMVHPQWQKKRIGTAMMEELSRWLEAHAADRSLVGLYTGETLAPFYRQFDFTPAYGMTRTIRRNKV